MQSQPPSNPRVNELLAEVGWVRGLARRLAGDAHTAEDWFQDAMLVALQSERESQPPLRQWLAAVLRNIGRASRRKERNREARERDTAARLEVRSTAELVERASVQRRLVGLLLELQEPDRSLLLLRYFDELSVAEIAAHLGLPRSTVSSRLARALERMRERLQRHSAQEPGSWLAALTPLRRWSGRGVRASRASTRPLATALSGPSTALLMSTQTKLLLTLGTLAGAFAVWRVSSPQAPELLALQSSEEVLAPGALEALPSRAEPLRMELAAAEAESAPAAPPASAAEEVASVATTREIQGRAIDTSGAPLAGIALRARQREHSHAAGKLPESPWTDIVRSGSDGSFALLVGAGAQQIEIESDSYRLLVGDWIPAGEERVVLVLGRAIELAGTVSDRSGRPIAGAELALTQSDALMRTLGVVLDHTPDIDIRATSDAEGAFHFAGAVALPDGRLAVAKAGYRSWQQPQPQSSDEFLAVVLEELEAGGGQLAGHVLLPDGMPATSALVSVGMIAVRTDESGAFVLDAIHPYTHQPAPPGPLTVRALQVGFGAASVEVSPASAGPPETWPRDLVLQLGELSALSSIRGLVVDADGQPLPDARIFVLDRTAFGGVPAGPGAEYFLEESVESLLGKGFGRVSAGADGRFVLNGLLERSYRLEALDLRTLASRRTEPIPAGSSEVRIVIEAAELSPIAGHVLDSEGRGIAGVRVSAVRHVDRFGFDYGASATTDEAGAFELSKSLLLGTHLCLEGADIVPEYRREIPPQADPEALELVIGRRCHVQFEWPQWSHGKATEVRVLDEAGEPLTLVVIRQNMTMPSDSALIFGELSEVYAVSDRAREAVVLHGERELARSSLHLVPGEVQRVRL